MNKKIVFDGLRSLKRMGETAVVSAKAGLKYAKAYQQKQPISAQLLRETFEQLGTTYIKLGQFIASTPSLFPREYVEEFQKCLDQAPALPFSYIRQVLIQEFKGKPLHDIFAWIDEKPLASASIAQVHAARLITGEDVVIKVQKPNVDTILYTDLNVVHGVSLVIEKIMPKIKFASFSEIAEEIKIRMVKEIDFYAEAKNLDDFNAYLQQTGNTVAIAPKVYHQYSTQKVLTMQRLYGVPLTDMSVIQQRAYDPSQVLINVMNTWFGSLSHCESFHADLHAGNVLLLDDGRIGFIDFGIVGQLKAEVWSASMAFMDALQMMDYQQMAENMLKMGMTHQQVDVAKLTDDLQRIFNMAMETDPSHILQSSASDLNAVILDLVAVGERHGIKFPRDFALLLKQMLYFDRFMRVLTPYTDIYADQRLQMLQEPTMIDVHKIQ
ncbi:AarF/ABC1/UbiB kinase family protein [Moraxella sp. ZY210820]|uniref:ABC1 kinase family protein n=1 Tax=unclassified Moraxella TaxID=2685852 RepID=UPI0027302552|nr:AarF/UbiB family protein [Moraxella sp. ZY210820]WLF84753.1 AarF/UbiB family protein [Moraxella sp. ZY210820]